MRATLKPLFDPFTYGSLTCDNRIVMSPMTRNFSPNGVPGSDVAAYYARRAEAGVGLLITEGTGVDHPAAIGSGSMGEHDIPLMHGNAPLEGWRKVVEAVHAKGGKIAPQLWHMGGIRLNGTGPYPDARSIRASGIWGPLDKAILPPEYIEAVSETSVEASQEDIESIIAGFARSAKKAVDIGFDAIAIHGGHGYLLDSFMWAETNKRTDQYGGSTANRARLAADVVCAIRAEIPADMPIIYRFSQWKLQDYDAKPAKNPQELSEMLMPLVEAGVDIFDASTRRFEVPAFEGSEMGLAGWARQITGKPTMCVGGIGFDRDLQTSFAMPTEATDNLDVVAKHFAEDEFDLVAVGRAILMDAGWIGKVRTGEKFKAFDLSAYGSLD